MVKESVLIVGLGEVGHALFDLFSEKGGFDVYGFDLNRQKLRAIAGRKRPPKTVDVMHICIPCGKQIDFVKASLSYVKRFEPKLMIIESTVPPGTTRKVYESAKSPVAHSPIRGMHESLETMKKDVLFWTKYVGGATKHSAEEARRHFEKLGLTVKVLSGPEETELAKLFETTYRAWMIACFQEMHRISRHFGADFSDVTDMIEDVHRHRLNKPLHFPGYIGGHCLIPNTELLEKACDSEFLRLILKSNKKRREEMKDKTVWREAEKVRKKAETLQKDLMKKLGEDDKS